MRRIRPVLVVLLTAALAVAVAPAAAPAKGKAPLVTQVYLVYQSNGKVPPCTFTAAQLKQALGQVTPDIKQYAPDFEDAIRTALEARAAGACAKKSGSGSSSSGAPATTGGGGTTTTQAAPTTTQAGSTTTQAAAPTTATTTPQPDPTVTPAPSVNDDAIPAAATGPVSSGADDAPAPLLVLAIMLGTLLVLAALWLGVRWLGFDPPWLARWRHATQEAGWRASAAWSEFTDWVRLGR